MQVTIWLYLLLGLGIIFGPILVTRGHQKYSHRALVAKGAAYSTIRGHYWGASLLVMPVFFGVIWGTMALADYLPSIALQLRLFAVLLGFAVFTLYKCVFALVTQVFPVERFEGFVIAEPATIRRLAWRSIWLTLALLVIGLGLAVLPLVK